MRTRLALDMFLEYAVQGLWAVPLAAFLMGSPHEGGLNMPAGHVALIYATMAIGATLTPLLLGLLCDRLFAMQRMLAVLHLIGAGILGAVLCWCVQSQGYVRAAFDTADERDKECRVSSDLYRIDYLTEYLRNPTPEHMRQVRRRQLVNPITKIRYWIGLDSTAPEERLRIAEMVEGLVFYKQLLYPTVEEARSTLDELRTHVRPGIERFRSDPAVIAAAERAFPPLFFLMLAYSCAYIPTISLTNVVAFRNLPNPARQYGPFRALGTLGWIAAGLFIGFAAPAVSPLPFLFAAIASGVLGVVCFFLPHTPPIHFRDKPGGSRIGDAFGMPALRMLGERSFLVYVLTALVATALMPFHNIYTNKFLVDLHVDHPAAVQTLAQPTEILGALMIPWVWWRIGTKWMLTLGLIASAGRFFMFASESVSGVIALGLPLHGIGFAFFYIAAALYVDREAPTDLRASAQGLVTVITLGLGGIVGAWFAGWLVGKNTTAGVVDWRVVWLVPAVGTLIAAAGFAMMFGKKERIINHRGTEDTEKAKNVE